MLEQRVQTFRQLMRETGGSAEMELFTGPLLLSGYTPLAPPNNHNYPVRPGNPGPVVYGRRNMKH